jgi:hypothetical protein
MGSETESDDHDIIQEVLGSRPPPLPPVSSTTTIISPSPTIPARDRCVNFPKKMGNNLSPGIDSPGIFASPRNSPPRATPSPAPHPAQQSFVPYNERATHVNGQSEAIFCIYCFGGFLMGFQRIIAIIGIIA